MYLKQTVTHFFVLLSRIALTVIRTLRLTTISGTMPTRAMETPELAPSPHSTREHQTLTLSSTTCTTSGPGSRSWPTCTARSRTRKRNPTISVGITISTIIKVGLRIEECSSHRRQNHGASRETARLRISSCQGTVLIQR